MQQSAAIGLQEAFKNHITNFLSFYIETQNLRRNPSKKILDFKNTGAMSLSSIFTRTLAGNLNFGIYKVVKVHEADTKSGFIAKLSVNALEGAKMCDVYNLWSSTALCTLPNICMAKYRWHKKYTISPELVQYINITPEILKASKDVGNDLTGLASGEVDVIIMDEVAGQNLELSIRLSIIKQNSPETLLKEVSEFLSTLLLENFSHGDPTGHLNNYMYDNETKIFSIIDYENVSINPNNSFEDFKKHITFVKDAIAKGCAVKAILKIVGDITCLSSKEDDYLKNNINGNCALINNTMNEEYNKLMNIFYADIILRTKNHEHSSEIEKYVNNLLTEKYEVDLHVLYPAAGYDQVFEHFPSHSKPDIAVFGNYQEIFTSNDNTPPIEDYSTKGLGYNKRDSSNHVRNERTGPPKNNSNKNDINFKGVLFAFTPILFIPHQFIAKKLHLDNKALYLNATNVCKSIYDKIIYSKQSLALFAVAAVSLHNGLCVAKNRRHTDNNMPSYLLHCQTCVYGMMLSSSTNKALLTLSSVLFTWGFLNIVTSSTVNSQANNNQNSI